MILLWFYKIDLIFYMICRMLVMNLGILNQNYFHEGNKHTGQSKQAGKN